MLILLLFELRLVCAELFVLRFGGANILYRIKTPTADQKAPERVILGLDDVADWLFFDDE